MLPTNPSSVPCPHCVNGTITVDTGPLYWQVQTVTCSFCKGSGKLKPKPKTAA
jgi:DnaJ-class molecular chaperone